MEKEFVQNEWKQKPMRTMAARREQAQLANSEQLM